MPDNNDRIPWQSLVVWNDGGSLEHIGRAPITSLGEALKSVGSSRYIAHLGGIEVKKGRLVKWRGFALAPPGGQPEQVPEPDVDWRGFVTELTAHRKTGYLTAKRYQCTSCGHITTESTNHYGDIYPRCPNCGWKHPMETGQVFKCLEPLPEGWSTPAPWKTVKLGDVTQVTVARRRTTKRPRLTR